VDRKFSLVSLLEEYGHAMAVPQYQRSSDAFGSSALECQAYVKHRFGSDEFIGGTKETIESLLAEAGTGGQHFSSRTYLLTILLPPAITRELCKYDAHGNQDKTNTLFEFTIVTVPEASNAAVLDMAEAVTQADNTADRMAAAPSSLEATNLSVAVINGTESVSHTWGPLLQKIRLFTDLVDTISEV